MSTEKINLEKIQVCQITTSTNEFVQNAKLFTGKSHDDYMRDTLTTQMRFWLTAQPLRKYTFSKPASLWDHIKIVCLPHVPICFAWMFTPGREVTEIVEAGVFYPDIILPNQRSVAYIRNV